MELHSTIVEFIGKAFLENVLFKKKLVDAWFITIMTIITSEVMVPVYEPRVLVATSCLGELLRASIARSSTFINKSVRFFSLLSVPIPSIAFSFISFFLLCFHPFLSLFLCFLSFVVAKRLLLTRGQKRAWRACFSFL
jgi:hypothetical protein